MHTFIIFGSGFLSGIVLMLLVGFIYALRKPHKLKKPIEDFQNRRQTKLYQDLLKQYEGNRKN